MLGSDIWGRKTHLANKLHRMLGSTIYISGGGKHTQQRNYRECLVLPSFLVLDLDRSYCFLSVLLVAIINPVPSLNMIEFKEPAPHFVERTKHTKKLGFNCEFKACMNSYSFSLQIKSEFKITIIKGMMDSINLQVFHKLRGD